MNKYTEKISIPQYQPKGLQKGKKAIITTKYDELVKEINESNLSEREKQFLRLSATRFIEFDYSVMAEYYCVTNKEMQHLMEKLALVIIDFDDAIANGYIKLNKQMEEIVSKRKEESND